jgi:large subunit ribosomal protein L29
MKIREIREIGETELQQRIIEEQENLAHLKFQKSVSQLESPIKIRSVRRTIARMKTVLREKVRMKGKTVAADTPQSETKI